MMAVVFMYEKSFTSTWYDITQVCFFLSIFGPVGTKLQTLVTIWSAFFHQSVRFA